MSPAPQAGGWRGSILSHFTAAGAAAGRVTVALDPDALLAEPGVNAAIRSHSYELVLYEDPVAFRLEYETRFREPWSRGQGSHLVVVIRDSKADRRTVPFDVLEEAEAAGRVLSFGLGEVFPSLASTVVAQLDVATLDALAAVVERCEGERLGENATKDFVLRHVFELAPELIRSSADMLRALLRKHYRAMPVPAVIDDRMLAVLARNPAWQSWPLDQIVCRREAFLAFLQERWGPFLRDRKVPLLAGQKLEPLRYPGPDLLPFDHDDVRIYMDNLFADGLLRPTAAFESKMVEGSWWRVGVVGDPVDDALLRLERLLPELKSGLPSADADHLVWSAYAMRWGEAMALRARLSEETAPPVGADLDVLHEEIESRFAAWMITKFGALCSLPHLPAPRTLDKVARFLAHQRTARGEERRVALVVVDGLAIDQWVVLRESLDGLRCEEAATFAWVPTLTTVSRQTIFSGETPFYFAQHIHTTIREPAHWARFWDDHGLRGAAVAYRSQGHADDAAFLGQVRQVAEQPACRVLGLVVTTVDRLLHGAITGSAGLHASVRHWAKGGSFRRLLDLLRKARFDVFVTSDHGNIEARGIGKPNVGAVASERGERVHVFPDDLTRQRTQNAFEGSMVWPGYGLPADYRPLIAPGRKAFVAAGSRMVGHGGIALEEVIVPWIKVMAE